MSTKAQGQQQIEYAEYDERHTDENHPYDGSGLAPRTCTDLFCLVIFGAFLAGMLGVTGYAFQNGNPRRLTHGFNYKGQLCGVDEAVKDMPLIYWCGAGSVQANGIPTALDLKFPTCVRKCPSDKYTEMACLGVEQVQVDTVGTSPFTTEKTTITQSTVKQMSYPTMELGGLYCIPRLTEAAALPGDDDLTKSLMGPDGPLGEPWSRFTTSMGGLRRCWPVLALTVLVSIGLGYGYLFALRYAAKQLVEATLFLLTVGLMLLGAFFLVGTVLTGGAQEKWQASNLLFEQLDMETASSASRLAGMTFTILGLLMLCVVCCAQEAIETALGCVEAACECIFSMPSMLLQPAVEACWKLVLASSFLCGLTWLLSTADMQPDYINVKDEVVGGLTRSFVFSDEGKAMVVYYLAGCFWLMELSHAMSQFIISYSVVLWYYTPKPKGFGPHIPLVRGFIVGVVFHLGTLAMGAFLISLCRGVRIVLGYVSKQAKTGSNHLSEMIAQCMMCCISCFQRHVEFISKNAYIDVCISSTSFITASKNSFGFLASEGGKVMLLTGACVIVSFTGVLGISGVTGGLAYVLVTSSEAWMSETSPQHVANPYFVAGVASLLAGMISVCFMVVFDHTADTLIYTYVWNKSHGHNTVQKYTPETLASLLEYKPISKMRGQGGRVSAGIPPTVGSNGGMFNAFSTFFTNPSQRQHNVNTTEESQALMRGR